MAFGMTMPNSTVDYKYVDYGMLSGRATIAFLAVLADPGLCVSSEPLPYPRNLGNNPSDSQPPVVEVQTIFTFTFTFSPSLSPLVLLCRPSLLVVYIIFPAPFSRRRVSIRPAACGPADGPGL